jgi:hypothetical protein
MQNNIKVANPWIESYPNLINLLQAKEQKTEARNLYSRRDNMNFCNEWSNTTY